MRTKLFIAFIALALLVALLLVAPVSFLNAPVASKVEGRITLTGTPPPAPTAVPTAAVTATVAPTAAVKATVAPPTVVVSPVATPTLTPTPTLFPLPVWTPLPIPTFSFQPILPKFLVPCETTRYGCNN